MGLRCDGCCPEGSLLAPALALPLGSGVYLVWNSVLLNGSQFDSKAVFALLYEVLWDERGCCIFPNSAWLFGCGS